MYIKYWNEARIILNHKTNESGLTQNQHAGNRVKLKNKILEKSNGFLLHKK